MAKFRAEVQTSAESAGSEFEELDALLWNKDLDTITEDVANSEPIEEPDAVLPSVKPGEYMGDYKPAYEVPKLANASGDLPEGYIPGTYIGDYRPA